MRSLRSLLFDVLFYMSMAVILILGIPCFLGPQKFTNWMYPTAGRLTLFLLKKIVRLDVRIEGQENIPAGPVIFACKHQSAWETFVLGSILHNPSVVLKRELAWIPILGILIKHQQGIPVARGKSDIKTMLRLSQKVVATGRSFIIFPEGTRHIAGTPVTYNRGVEMLYKALHIPVVPIALNSGTFWPRRSVIKKPGLITLRFLSAIHPGHDNFMGELETRIETACRDIEKISHPKQTP